MTNEDNIKDLLTKKHKKMIGTKEFEFEELDLDQMGLMDINENMSQQEQLDKTRELISVSIGIPVENLRKVSVKHILDFQDFILDINGFKKEKENGKSKLDKIDAMHKRMSAGK